MAQGHKVAVVGFSSFERSTLESFFRLSARGPRAGANTLDDWTLVPAWDGADLLVADADLPGATRVVIDEGRVADALFVGGMAAPAGAAGWLPRPIDALQIRRALDDILARRAQRQLETALPRHERRSAGPSARARQLASIYHRVADFRSSDGFSNSVLVEEEVRLDSVLVASADLTECRTLRHLLARLGYEVRLTSDAHETLRLTREHGYGFVFIGRGFEGLDPFQVCRQIKRPDHGPGRPVVVVLAEQRPAVDRIRATFAGADAYLGLERLEEELLRVLARHDNAFERVFEPTAPLAI